MLSYDEDGWPKAQIDKLVEELRLGLEIPEDGLFDMALDFPLNRDNFVKDFSRFILDVVASSNEDPPEEEWSARSVIDNNGAFCCRKISRDT